MEVLGLVDVPTWLQWLLLLAGLVAYYIISMSWNHGIFKKMGVKGPKPHPILGNFNLYLKDGQVKTDQNMYRTYGKLFGMHDTYMPCLFIGDPDLIKEILVKQFKSFANRKNVMDDFTDPKFVEMLTLLKDDHWRFVRSAMVPSFSAKKLRQMTQLINHSVDKLLENIERKIEVDEDIDMRKFAGRFAIDKIASTVFGIDVERHYDMDDSFTKHAKVLLVTDHLAFFISIIFIARFLAWVLTYMNRFGKNKYQEAFSFFIQTTKTAVQERRQNLGKYCDVLGTLLDTEARKPEEEPETIAGDSQKTAKEWTRKKLTDSEITSQAMLFIFAGYHTTSSQLCFLFYHLALYPEICDKLQQEIDQHLNGEVPTYDTVNKLTYLEMVINESMRIFPAATRLTRVSSNDVTIGNTNIPKGMTVNIPVGAIHKDPQYWPDPETFNPERFTAEAKAGRNPFVYMPFGDGPRNCVGMRLAVLEIKVTVCRVLQKYRPVKSSRTEVPIKVSMIGNLPLELFLKFEKRN